MCTHVQVNNLCLCLRMYKEQRKTCNYKQTYGSHVQKIFWDSYSLGEHVATSFTTAIKTWLLSDNRWFPEWHLWIDTHPGMCVLPRKSIPKPLETYMHTYSTYSVHYTKLCQVLTGCKAQWLVWESGTMTEPKSPVCGEGSGILYAWVCIVFAVNCVIMNKESAIKRNLSHNKGLLAQLCALRRGAEVLWN